MKRQPYKLSALLDDVSAILDAKIASVKEIAQAVCPDVPTRSAQAQLCRWVRARNREPSAQRALALALHVASRKSDMTRREKSAFNAALKNLK